MKLVILITLILTLISSAQAAPEAHHDHESHDWRTDKKGYAGVSKKLPIRNRLFGENKITSPKVQRIDMDYFKATLSVLSGKSAVPNRNEFIVERAANKNLDLTRQFLADEYSKLGFTISSHQFSSGVNFIAERKGFSEPEKILILSSHIDSVGNSGANDDGTGTAALLAIARELSQKNHKYTLRIIGFDREEKGLVGSKEYVKQIKGENIIADIQFEMFGHHSKNDGIFHVIDCNLKHSLFLSTAMIQSAEQVAPAVQISKTCTDRSDHASFWSVNIPAIVISENFFGGDADPCYHQKCDVLDDRLNYPYMQNIMEVTLSAVESL